ncbi:MAG: hypothetical protein ACRDQX_03175 [Pseudonocardiaceae bacterium]
MGTLGDLTGTPAPTVWPALAYADALAAIRFLVEAGHDVDLRGHRHTRCAVRAGHRGRCGGCPWSSR